MWFFSVVPTAWDIFSDNLIQFLKFDFSRFGFEIADAAADVRSQKTWQNLLADRHGKSDRSYFSGVYIRHQTDIAFRSCFVITDPLDLCKSIVFCGIRIDDCGSISSFDFLHKKSTSIVEIQTAFEVCIRILHFFHQNTPFTWKGFWRSACALMFFCFVMFFTCLFKNVMMSSFLFCGR